MEKTQTRTSLRGCTKLPVDEAVGGAVNEGFVDRSNFVKEGNTYRKRIRVEQLRNFDERTEGSPEEFCFH